MSSKELIIEGARQNNLRNISLRLPHNRVIAVTGVSGSGKSSLAFDTIYAEGQWRFIESLSTYARLFLEKLDRPDVDRIANVRPAIPLEQKNPVRGSRSTVGTLTEIYELLRLLYSKIAVPFCPSCGREIRKWDPAQIVSHLRERYTGSRAAVVFTSASPFDELRKQGYQRVWRDGKIQDLGDADAQAGTHEVVLDRLVIRDDPRLADSVETAWREGKGQVTVILLDDPRTPVFLRYSRENACEECGISLPEPSAILFSFNHPVGACPECKGFGNTLRYAEDLIIPDPSLSLRDGAVDPWNKPAYTWWKKQFLAKAKPLGLNPSKPFAEFSSEERDLLYHGGHGAFGINDFFEDLEGRRYKLHVRVFLARYRRGVTCPVCGGKRLKPEALAYRVAGFDIADLCRMPVSHGVRFFADLEISPNQREIAKELLHQVRMKLEFLENVGLEYLTLDRYGKTLSGGEYQRINLSNQLAALLTGTLYVLDEPTVGLHARDTEKVAAILKRLAELGNTVIAVEHDRGIIEAADWIVELGPGGGRLGGDIVFSGPEQDFRKTDTLTSRYMRGIERVAMPARTQGLSPGVLEVSGARGNNLKGVALKIPLRKFVVVTGVSGSGKSSLVVETLYPALAKAFRSDTEAALPYDRLIGAELLRGVKLIDQSPIGRSPRSNPVTYLKIFDHIRRLFSSQREARAYGYGPGFFSFNVPGGRCETCKGDGYELMEMYFFENLYIRCEKCGGARYRPEALRIRYGGKNISEVLEMTVDEAAVFFADQPAIREKFRLMHETGIGYLKLGQPATTLSGGEAQRLKICAEMGGVPAQSSGKARSAGKAGDLLYILDEPTVGLHFADVQGLLNILARIVDAGNTVVVIEHNLDVIRAADWIIDLGPEGGERGGEILFEGTPEKIVKVRQSYTGRYLGTTVLRPVRRVRKAAR